MLPTKENRPAGNGAESRTAGCTQYIYGLRQRRAATYRLPVLDCGCRDPWTCHCATPELTADSAVAAADHLRRHGLSPLFSVSQGRALWRGGHRDIATLCVQQVSA
ncbi:hypothetical protein MCHIJ_43290 [Mycolicibacterium chitae]|nr:hypothetical protein MCHIJ_43290 [Mycolicibacterium chitae]